jgi:hypothetical protein
MAYPGSLSPDSINQISQILDRIPTTNMHPVLHTWLMTPFVTWGEHTGNLAAGVAAFVVFQVLVTSAAVTYALVRMQAWGWGKNTVLALGAIYALFPPFAINTVTPWKDTMFGFAVLCLLVVLVDSARLGKDFFASPSKWATLIAFALAVTLLRSNGIYVVALSVLVWVIFAKGLRLQFAALGLVCVVFYAVWVGPISKAAGVGPGSAAEAMSIPSQQIGRVLKYHSDDLTPEQNKTVDRLFSLEGWWSKAPVRNAYNPRLSDYVKNRFDPEWFADHKKEVVDLWWDLGRDHPGDYLDSFLAGNYGYWYPEAINETVQLRVVPNKLGLTEDMSFLPEVRALYNKISLSNPRDVPVVSMFFSIAFTCGMIALAALVLALNRNYRLLIPLVPLGFLWLTTLASPVFAEYRYVFGIMLCGPLAVFLAWRAPSKVTSIEP